MEREKVSIPYLQEMKIRDEKIVCTTCYDYPTGLLLDTSGVDMVMIGDSVGMVLLGYENTVPVTMDEIIHHAKAVVKACKTPLIVGDMPFGSYNTNKDEAISNATRLMKEAGVDTVKVEGERSVVETVRAIINAGIPVMGHIGVTPQTVSKLGGYKARGKQASEAKALIEGAIALEEAGAFAIELECITVPVAKLITEKLKIPTVGFGSGPYCDGQGLVLHDILGLYDRPIPKLAKSYVNLSRIIVDTIQSYTKEVREGEFPNSNHSFIMPDEELRLLKEQLNL